jgi:hypothetical protein
MGWQEVHNNRSLLAVSLDVIKSYPCAVGVNFLFSESFRIQRIMKIPGDSIIWH